MKKTSRHELFTSIQATPRKWVVTGAAGFIGSHLVQKLLELDQQVVGLDNFSTGHQENLDDIEQSVKPGQWNNFMFLCGDIRDIDACRESVSGADCVLHQAALGSVPHSIDDPAHANENNINGFLNMLMASRDAGVQSFVYAASSATYGDDPTLPKREETVGRPLSPYALTKYVNELYADVFRTCYDFSCIGLRYFNVFGPRQDPEGAYAAVIPKWFSALVRGQRPEINGDGETSRDFCYVDNTVQANLLAATTQNPDARGQVYNVALGTRTTLNQLFRQIRNIVSNAEPDANGIEPLYRDFRPGDIRHSLADIAKASTMLGYRPDINVDEGLRRAAAWYLQHA